MHADIPNHTHTTSPDITTGGASVKTATMTPEQFLQRLTALCRDTGFHIAADEFGALWAEGNHSSEMFHGFSWDSRQQRYATY